MSTALMGAAISLASLACACAECTDGKALTGSAARSLVVGHSSPRTWRLDLSPELHGEPRGRPTLVADSTGGVAYALRSTTRGVLVGRVDAGGHPLWTRSFAGRRAPPVLCVAPSGDLATAMQTTKDDGVALMMLGEGGRPRWEQTLPDEFVPPIRMVATDERLFVIAPARIDLTLYPASLYPRLIPDLAVGAYRWDGTRVARWLLPRTKLIDAAAIGEDLVLAVWTSPDSPVLYNGSPASYEVVTYEPCGHLRWRRRTVDPIEVLFASGGGVDVVLGYRTMPNLRVVCPPGDLRCRIENGTIRDDSDTLMRLTETGAVGWRKTVRTSTGWNLEKAEGTGELSNASFVSVSRCSESGGWTGNRRGERLVRLTPSAYICDSDCISEPSQYALLDAQADLFWQRGILANPEYVTDDGALALGEDGSVFESATERAQDPDGGIRLPVYVARTR
jgi:hypothetical protein